MPNIKTSYDFNGQNVKVKSTELADNSYVYPGDLIVDKTSNKIYIVKKACNFEKSKIEVLVNSGSLAPVEAELLKVSKPTVKASSNYAKPGDTVTLTASGSHSPDSPNITYHWVLPDGTTKEGDTLLFVVPASAKEGDKYTILCYATDDLNNKSPSESVTINVVENYPPVIQKIEWSSEILVAGNTYHAKMTAIDPEATALTYTLTASDPTITITETTPGEWDVSFPKKSTTYTVDFTFTVTDADGRSATEKQTKTILVVKERVFQFPDSDTESVYAKTVDNSLFVYVVQYTKQNKVWVGTIDISGNIHKQFEIPDFNVESAGYANNYLVLIGKNTSNETRIIKTDLDGNIVKAITHDFDYAHCIVNDNNLYSLFVNSDDVHWGRYVLFDDNLNLIVAKKVEYNRTGDKYSDSHRRFMDFANAKLVVSGDNFEVVSRSLLYYMNRDEARVRIKLDGTLEPIGYRNSPDGVFKIIGHHNTFTSYRTMYGKYVALTCDAFTGKFLIYAWDGTENKPDNQNWIVASYSLLKNRPIVQGNTDRLLFDQYTTNQDDHWNIFRLNNKFSFKEGFESVAFTSFGYEFFIGNIDNKASFIGLLQSYDLTDRGCGGVNISPYDGSFYRVSSYSDSWSSITHSSYQLYFYDFIVNTSTVTSTISTNSTSIMFVSCELT